jgi:hypothetical protein
MSMYFSPHPFLSAFNFLEGSDIVQVTAHMIPLTVVCIPVIFLGRLCGHLCSSVIQNEHSVPGKLRVKFSELLYECIVIFFSFNTFS